MTGWTRPGRHCPDLPPMCAPCADEWARWLDYQPPAPFRIWPATKSGTYEGTAAGIENLRQALAGDHYRTIRRQQEHVERLCAAGNHAVATEADG